jgi:hypothetical protein
LATSDDGNLRVTIAQDDDPMNPRTDYDNLASMIVVSQDWDMDKDPGPLGWVWKRLASRYRTQEAVALFMRYARIYHGATVVEHRPYNGPWSIFYLTREVADGPDGTPDPAAYVAGEIATWDQYLEGDIYGYVLEERVIWRADGRPSRESWEVVDSCWGFYGREDVASEARAVFRAHLTA